MYFDPAYADLLNINILNVFILEVLYYVRHVALFMFDSRM